MKKCNVHVLATIILSASLLLSPVMPVFGREEGMLIDGTATQEEAAAHEAAVIQEGVVTQESAVIQEDAVIQESAVMQEDAVIQESAATQVVAEEINGCKGTIDESTVREKYRRLTLGLIENKLQITTMESCTSGQVASLLTDTEGSSAVVKGAFITYSNEAKIRQGVPAQLIEQYGVYSPETAASEMWILQTLTAFPAKSSSQSRAKKARPCITAPFPSSRPAWIISCIWPMSSRTDCCFCFLPESGNKLSAKFLSSSVSLIEKAIESPP